MYGGDDNCWWINGEMNGNVIRDSVIIEEN